MDNAEGHIAELEEKVDRLENTIQAMTWAVQWLAKQASYGHGDHCCNDEYEACLRNGKKECWKCWVNLGMAAGLEEHRRILENKAKCENFGEDWDKW